MKFNVGNRAHFSDIWWKFSEPGETNDSTYELKLSCQETPLEIFMCCL